MPNNSSLEIVKLLIENGADLSIKDGLDRTAFDVAKLARQNIHNRLSLIFMSKLQKIKKMNSKKIARSLAIF